MVSGHRVVQQQIGREAHAWLEYWDQDSEDWKEVDPTGGEVMDRKPQQIVGTMRIIRSSDLDSAKTEAIKSYSAKYSEELACEGAAHLLPYRDNPEFINRFKRRVDAMNLLGEKSVTPKHRYTTENRGTLDIQRVVEGRLDCFKIRTLEEETQSSPIYLYHTLDSRKWQNEMFQTAFPMPLYPVIDQLVDMGVPLYYMDKGTAIAVKSGASLNKLVAEQLVNDVVQTATVEGEDKTNKGEIHLKDREESDRIFNKLAQIYYQTLAEQISMDRGADPERGDHGVMQEAIYRGSIQIPMMHTLLLPFKIPTAEGEKVLTEMDFDTLSQKLPLDLKNKPVTDEESDLFPINVFSPIVQHRIVQFMELHIDTMKHPFYHKQMLMAYQAAEKVGSDGVKSLVEFKQREAYENIKLRWPLGT